MPSDMPTTCLLALVLAGFPLATASADIFKYTKPDGSVAYTDKLSDLPEDRRVHYNRQIAEREKQRASLERQLGKEELERREAEAERERAEREIQDEQERAQRLAKIDAQIKLYRQREQAKERSRAEWQQRVKVAQERLDQLLAEFSRTQSEYDELAVRADFTLLPGQGKKKVDLEKKLKALEKAIDQQIIEVEENIPTAARRAGIPPGWLR